MTRWYRAYEGTVTDSKLSEAALVAETSRSVVIATWHAILESCAVAQAGGHFDTTPRRIAAALCEPANVIEAVFSALTEVGMIEGNVVGAWAKRQFESDSSTERSRKHRATARSDNATSPQRCATPPETETEAKTDKKESSRAVAVATRSGSSEKFEEFWKAYPKRDGNNPKFSAEKKFRAAVKSGTDPDAIVSAAGRYADQMRSRGQEGTQFVAQAETWLNKRQWMDYGPPTLEQSAPLEGFYAEDESEELEAWDIYTRKTTGIGLMRDRRGGWRVKSRWPPGYEPRECAASEAPAINPRPM